MEAIRIQGEAGQIIFVPTGIPKRLVEKIERKLRAIVSAPKGYLTASEMRSLLKTRDPLIGTPGGTLKAYRLREEMTQDALAKKAHLKQGHLSEMERNKRPLGIKVAKKLARALGCDYRRLL